MCVVLVPNISLSTSISNTTQIRSQYFRHFMCVHWECAWCQCQILVLAPAYPTLHKYAHSTSERSCVSTGNVRGASAKYWYQHQHIQHYTNTPTVVKKLHVCPLGMCVVLVPNISLSTSISNTTQIRSQYFRHFMCVHWECAWCQCQILVLAPAYPTLHKYANSTSETSCVSTGNVRGASAKYQYQHQHIQHYTNTPTVVKKLHVCPLGMCVVLVQNIGISTSISNTTQIRPQHFRIFMCVRWECTWCQCQILVLAPAYPTLHKYAHSTSEISCVSTGNVRGASAKYWYQHQHIQHYTNTPTALQKGHVCPLGMCVVLVPNIGISTSISNTTQMHSQQFKNFMGVHWEFGWCQCQILVLAPAYPALHKYANSTSVTSCVSTGNVHGASIKYQSQHHHIQHQTNTLTVLQKLHVCPLGMCVVLVPNIGISTSISNTTLIRPQHFRNFMCVHWECARASAKYWYQHQHIQHYTSTPTALQKGHVCPLGMCVVLVPNIGISTSISSTTQIRPQHFSNFMCVHWECAWCQCQILVLAPAYPTLHKYAHSTSDTSCVSTGNVRGASAKYWYQHQHIQHYTNTPTVVKKLHVCPLGMCVVLVPNIGISTSISSTTQIRPQQLRNFMCVRWECAWCQCQILVLAPAYPTLHKYAHSTSETSCVSAGNIRGASAKYWYQHQHIQHYTNTPTALQNLHVCPLGMYVVLVPNIGISTSISNTTQIRPQHFRKVMCVHWECARGQCQILVLAPAYPTLHKYAYSTLERSCVSTGNVRGASAKYWYQHQHIQHYTNALTAIQKLHGCPLGIWVVLVPNIGISTSISSTTQIRPQHFSNFMCVHWECAWCQYQILVLAPSYPTLDKYAHSTSETSCVSTGNVRGASAKYWYQHQHIQHYTNTPTALQKLHVCPLGMCAGQCQILVLAPAYPTLHKYAHSTSERLCVSTGNVRGASAKYWYQHQHIQHYTNTPTALQ